MPSSTGAPDGKNPVYNSPGTFRKVKPMVGAVTKKFVGAKEYGYNKVIAKIMKQQEGTTSDFQGDGSF